MLFRLPGPCQTHVITRAYELPCHCNYPCTGSMSNLFLENRFPKTSKETRLNPSRFSFCRKPLGLLGLDTQELTYPGVNIPGS